jgi:hypothetical protein
MSNSAPAIINPTYAIGTGGAGGVGGLRGGTTERAPNGNAGLSANTY